MKLIELTKTTPFAPEELKGIKQIYSEPPDEMQDEHTYGGGQIQNLARILWANGWRPLPDNSAYSKIFVNSAKPYIIKVNKKPDRAFAWFAFLTRKFPNIHFPKIGDAKVIKVKNQKYYVYLIEKLEEVNSASVGDIADFLRDMAMSWSKLDNDLRYAGALYVSDSYPEIDLTPELQQATKIIGKYSYQFRLDMHPGNIMKRNDGTIVIIDPYALSLQRNDSSGLIQRSSPPF